MLKYPGSRIGVIGSGHFGLDLLHHTRPYRPLSRAPRPRSAAASRFSPAAYEKMRFDSAGIQQISNGLTILQGLQPAGLGHWNSGSLYNPDDGLTYRVSAGFHSVDRFLARVCLVVPLLGETKTPAAGSAP